MNEATVQTLTRLEWAKIGLPYRNNVGACVDQNGRVIRYGLCNESKQLNDHIKSSDLIGGFPIQAYTELFGWTTLLVLGAIECKPSDWTFPNPTNKKEFAHCTAQARFHDIVRGAGGFAGFVTDPLDVHRIIRREA